MNPVLKRIFQLVIIVVCQAILLFLSAGSITWIEGWIYTGLYILMLCIAGFIMLPQRKEVIVERSKGASGGKLWDIWLTRAMAISSFSILIVAGLQERWGWFPSLNFPVQVLGGFLFLLGYTMVVWAIYSNPFFSSIVRIQIDRGHTTIQDGPYRYIRHPGYLGMITSAIGTPLLLNSLWSFVPFLIYVFLVIARVHLEDRTLHTELAGYKEYAARTKHRLLPGIW